MHLALGDGEFTPFKVSEYAAYERQTRRRLPLAGVLAVAGAARNLVLLWRGWWAGWPAAHGRTRTVSGGPSAPGMS